MGSIRLKGIEKWFGTNQVIKGLDLEIEDGEFVIFVGPSGCGKSTLLRLIAGLEEASRGQIEIDGTDVTAEPPSARALAMVFQSYALYPHMSVRENVAFPLKTAGMARHEIATRVAEAARILKLDPYLDRRPKALSGGQRQRVAIGRAIVRQPKAFLFDEPLSNLDAALRVDMRLEIARLHTTLKATMVYVTHDQVEAMTLADRIVVLSAGRIEQIGTPRALYDKPANLFVAQFIGSPKMNILAAETDQGRVRVKHAGKACGLMPLTTPGKAACLGIRPEHLTLVSERDALLEGIVELSEYLGADTHIHVDVGADEPVNVRLRSNAAPSPGARVFLGFSPQDAHLFDADGKAVSHRSID